MQDLFFYDFDFNPLMDIRKYISVNYTVNYCGYGKFEAHFPLCCNGLIEMLEANDYLLCTHGDHQAVISGWKIEDDIALYGNSPEWLMTRRGINSFSVSNTCPSDIAASVVSNAMGDFVTITAAPSSGTPTDYSLNEVRSVHDVVCEVLSPDHLGFRLRADLKNKCFVFETYSGKNSDIILSHSLRTAHSMVFIREFQDRATASGWFKCNIEDMGNWDARANNPILQPVSPKNAFRYYKIVSDTYTQFGLQCTKGSYIYSDTMEGVLKISNTRPQPVWVYENNPDVCGAKKWDCIIPGTKNREEALLQIKSKTPTSIIESEVRRLEYGKDYLPGDVVRVQFEAGDFKKTVSKRITGINIFYDTDREGICPILSD